MHGPQYVSFHLPKSLLLHNHRILFDVNSTHTKASLYVCTTGLLFSCTFTTFTSPSGKPSIRAGTGHGTDQHEIHLGYFVNQVRHIRRGCKDFPIVQGLKELPDGWSQSYNYHEANAYGRRDMYKAHAEMFGDSGKSVTQFPIQYDL